MSPLFICVKWIYIYKPTNLPANTLKVSAGKAAHALEVKPGHGAYLYIGQGEYLRWEVVVGVIGAVIMDLIDRTVQLGRAAAHGEVAQVVD